MWVRKQAEADAKGQKELEKAEETEMLKRSKGR
jgi:hypothetical protein